MFLKMENYILDKKEQCNYSLNKIKIFSVIKLIQQVHGKGIELN
jgi:hypothetical protein